MYKLENKDYLEFLSGLEDNSIDCVITDPPYRFDTDCGKGSLGIKQYWKDLALYDSVSFSNEDIITMLNLLKDKMKTFNGYFFCNKELVPLYTKYAIKNKMFFDILVLLKENCVPACNGHYLPDIEYIIRIHDNGATFNKGLELRYYTKYRMTYSYKKKIHPAQKPVEVLKQYITVSTKPNDLICDPFMGSGSTGIACKEMKRRFIGNDINADWVKVAEERLSQELLFESVS